MQKLTVKHNKNGHNDADPIFEIEKQKKIKKKKKQSKPHQK